MHVGLIEQLAEWAMSVRRADIPDRVFEAARLQLLSVLASIHAGATTRNASASRRAALSLGTRGEATVIPTGEQVHPTAAVLANAAASMEHDFDDYLFLGHTGHSAVGVSLAVAEDADATLEDALVAQVVANEVAGRLGAYVAIGPQNGQLWAHIHIAAAVVAASRLYGLTAAQAADALGIGFYMPPFTLLPGFFGSDAKALTAAQPAAFGVYAARLAAEGMRGSHDILEHRRGFASHFAFLPIPALMEGLGDSWVSDSLSYKVYPGCAYVDGPVDALLAAVRGREVRARDVERIDIGGSALTAGMELLGEESVPADSLEPIAINFSARRSAAVALIAGGLSPRELSPAWLTRHRREVLALARRTRVRESRRLTLDMLDGIGRALSLPGLLRQVGLRGLLSVRRQLTDAFDHRAQRHRTQGHRTQKSRGKTQKGNGQPAPSRAGDALSSLRAVVSALGQRDRQLDMSVADFARLEFRFGAEVIVTLRDGRKLHGSQRIPLGAAGRDRAETRGLVSRKLAAELAAVGDEPRARHVEALTERPAEVSARELARANIIVEIAVDAEVEARRGVAQA